MLTDDDRKVLTYAADVLANLSDERAADLRAILARPPTVADLLPRVDAGHQPLESS